MKFDSHRKEERFKNLNPRKFLDEKADKFSAEEPRKLTSEGMDELESNLSGTSGRPCKIQLFCDRDFSFQKIPGYEIHLILFTRKSNIRVFQITC